jgi:hypothetical protein
VPLLTPTETRGPPEPVERDRVDPALGESEGKLLVVGVEPADVRQDDHAGAARLGGTGEERRELVAIGRGQRQLGRVERAARDREDRRARIVVETH